MERTKRLLSTYLPHIDLVLEVADARAPRATRWPSLDAMLGQVPRLLLLNKADLADPASTRRWLASFASDPDGPPALALCAGGSGVSVREAGRLRAAIKAAGRPSPRGAQKVAVVGVPNAGKSTVINLIAGARRAPSGAKPGMTRGKQWVVVSPDLWILDLPGVLPPSPRGVREFACLALTGTLPQGAFDAADVAAELVLMALDRLDPPGLAAVLDIDPETSVPASADPPAWLSAFALRRGLLGPNGEPHRAQAAQVIVAEFRRGRLGRLTLEEPSDDQT